MTASKPEAEPLLVIDDLRVEFPGPAHGRPRLAIDGVSFSVQPGETVAVVGESGSGKTVTALAVMGLLPDTARITRGSIAWGGQSLVGLADVEYCKLRGAEMALVPQDPFASLNPSKRVVDQVAEALLVHARGMPRQAARAQAVELLERVGITAVGSRAGVYPHQLSGGMRQRVMIAMAIANHPQLIIADEPTTALDVTIQAEVLDVLREVQQATGSALVLITHDLGIVAGLADRIVVMYAGRVVETGSLDELFYGSRHPYTRGLIASVPGASVPGVSSGTRRPLPVIPGVPPSGPVAHACAFHPRCPYAVERCRSERPELELVASTTATGGSESMLAHRSACWRAAEVPALVATSSETIAVPS